MKKFTETIVWTVEFADGNVWDYADCYSTVIADSEKKAWKKIREREDRPIKRIYEQKRIRHYK